MRKILLIVIGIIICNGYVFAEMEDETSKILDEYAYLYGDVFEDALDDADALNKFEELIPDTSTIEMFRELTRGRVTVSIPQLLSILIKGLLGEVYKSLRLMALVLAVAILCSYLTGLKEGFGKEGVSKAAFFVCYIIIATITSAAFYDAAELASGTIDKIAEFMKFVVPIVITSLLTSGAIVSATVFEPVLLGTVEIAVVVIQSFFIPMVMITTAMNIVNNLSDKFKTDKMVGFLNRCIRWGLNIMLTGFVSVAGLQSIAASGADGLTIKLTKFAAANLIPVVGGILSESVETVMNCSALIKNSVGIMGIICVAVVVAAPIIKLWAVLIIFRLTAPVRQPVSEPKMVVCITELANSISLLFSMLATTTVMFIMIITIIINAGNSAVMLGR